MSEQLLPFPRAEEVDEVIDLASMLSEEMRMYPTDSEFRLAIRGLTALHEEKSFSRMVADLALSASIKYAELLKKPREYCQYEDAFYAGGILGLHLATANLPGNLISKLHFCYDSELDELLADTSDVGQSGLLSILGELDQLNDEGFDPGDRELVTKAAELYVIDPTDVDSHYFFALGYRFSVIKAAEFSERFDEYDYLIEEYEQSEE